MPKLVPYTKEPIEIYRGIDFKNIKARKRLYYKNSSHLHFEIRKANWLWK